jgi:hypothetical protein
VVADKYRICPRNELSEECFAKPEHQLEFVSDTSVVKFKTGDRRIPNTIVQEGGGIGCEQRVLLLWPCRS